MTMTMTGVLITAAMYFRTAFCITLFGMALYLPAVVFMAVKRHISVEEVEEEK